MELTDLQKATLEIIQKHGKSNSITGKQIANTIGLKARATGKEGADMRSIINALRTKGFPVCADGEGYYWPSNSGELSAFINSLQGRIDKQQQACDGLKKGFDKIQLIQSKPLPQTEYHFRVAPRGKVVTVTVHYWGLSCTCDDYRWRSEKTCRHTIAVKKQQDSDRQAEANSQQGVIF